MAQRIALVMAIALMIAVSCAPAAPAGSPVGGTVSRQKLTLAYADDPSRVALLWALTNGKVTSPTLDVEVSFLPLAQIIPAANTKQFDAIEATPLAIPRTAQREPGFLILSAALVNTGGTLLVTGKASGVRTPADLKGKTVAVPSLGGTFVLETRYILSKKYGLNVDLQTGDVKFVETPPEAVAQLLKDGKLDAAVLTQLGTYRLKDSPDIRILSEVTKEAEALTGRHSASSLLVTYQDRIAPKSGALAELQRLLGASRAYLQEHRTEVLAAVARDKGVDAAFLEWFFTAYDLRAGPVTPADAATITATWDMAKAIGDIVLVPRVEDVLFRSP